MNHPLAGARTGPAAVHVPREIRRARVGVACAFFLTGFVFATWAARLPAIKRDLRIDDGELAIAFMGLNAGAIAGLQLGGLLVPRTGSRPALRVALPAFAAALVALAVAGNLAVLTAALVVSAAANSVVDVGMNAHGVAVEGRYGRPILSGLHAMHSLGGIAGAGLGAIAAYAAINTAAHFAAVEIAAGLAALATTRRLLPASVDAGPSAQGEQLAAGAVIGWFRGWTKRTFLFGVLAFCITLAEGGALDWGAIYLRDSLRAGPGLAAAGVGVFLAGVTVGRLAGDQLILRFGPVAMFRVGTLVAGGGFGVALLLATPAAGVLGLGLLGAGISYLLPLLFSAAGRVRCESAAAAAVVARVSTLGYLGSFVGPGLIGALAGAFGLPVALAAPAALVAVTFVAARALAPPTIADRT